MAQNPPSPGLHPEGDEDNFDLQWDDQLLYSKAVERHRPGHSWKNKSRSLKHLCMNYFINSAEKWSTIKRKTSVNTFDTMMPSFLRAQILDYIVEYCWNDGWEIKLPPHQLCSLICLLMPKEMKTVQLGSLLQTVYSGLQYGANIQGGIIDIMAQLSEESPNLKELTFDMHCDPRSKYRFDRHQIFLNLLGCNFQNLVKLSLGIMDNIGNKELQIIILNFPLLIYLDLELSPSINPRKLVASISRLKRLRFFFYMVRDRLYMEPRNKYHTLEDQIFSLCAENLPHLEYLRRLAIPQEVEFCSDKRILTFSGTSQLRQLCCAKLLPKASLPNLSDLCFEGPIKDKLEFDARAFLYKNLTTLELNNVGKKRVCLLLQRVGHQLNVLLLCSTIRFDDLKIMQLCPKLVKVQNSGGFYQNSLKSCLEYGAERNVRRRLYFLKNLKLDFHGTRAPLGLLKILLASSPKLEKLTIVDTIISSADCEFFSRIKCPSLQHFHLTFIKPAMNCSIRDLEMMVRGLVLHLPVSCCTVTLDPDFEEDSWDPYYNWDAIVGKFLLLKFDVECSW